MDAQGQMKIYHARFINRSAVGMGWYAEEMKMSSSNDFSLVYILQMPTFDEFPVSHGATWNVRARGQYSYIPYSGDIVFEWEQYMKRDKYKKAHENKSILIYWGVKKGYMHTLTDRRYISHLPCMAGAEFGVFRVKCFP